MTTHKPSSPGPRSSLRQQLVADAHQHLSSRALTLFHVVARSLPVLAPAYGGPGSLHLPGVVGARPSGTSAQPRPRRRTHPETRSLAKLSLSSMDYACMSIGVLLIFAITIINGHGRIFWEDETLGWVLLRDPSWHHMLHAWKLGADGGGIIFYILGRVWFRAFGDSVLAFRLFTATTFGMAFPVLWVALRRFYSVGVVAFAVFNTLFFSPPLTMHYMEGRFYGLLMLGTALALATALALDRLDGPVPRRWYAYTFAAHLLLTGSHVLGVVYSAFLLLAVVILDCLRGRRRPLLYAAAVASWSLLLFERTAIKATAAVGRPHFWTTAPHAGQVLGAYSVFSPEILTVLLLLTLTTLATVPRGAARVRAGGRGGRHSRFALGITAGCLLLVPLAFLLEGMVGTWLFTDRYLQPVALGITCLTAELACNSMAELRTAGFRNSRPWFATTLRTGFAISFALALLLWVFRHEAEYTPSVPDFTPQLTAHIPTGLPVVVEDAFTFTELMSQPAGAQRPYTFLLDWAYAVGPQAPRMEVTQFHLMQNWKLAGYFSRNIQNRQDFVNNNDHFLLVSNSILGNDPSARPETGNPLLHRFVHTPGYTAQLLFTLDRTDRDRQRDTVWLISRNQQQPIPVAPAPTYCLISSLGTSCR